MPKYAKIEVLRTGVTTDPASDDEGGRFGNEPSVFLQGVQVMKDAKYQPLRPLAEIVREFERERENLSPRITAALDQALPTLLEAEKIDADLAALWESVSG